MHVLGIKMECPSGQMIDLTTVPGGDFTSGSIGPCPGPDICQSLNCPGDCNGHGSCVSGTCRCLLGWTGSDCNTPTCVVPLNSSGGGSYTPTNTCNQYQYCDTASGTCKWIGAAPPSPPPAAISPPPAPPSPVGSVTGKVFDAYGFNCIMFEDLNGNWAADLFEYQVESDQWGGFTLSTENPNPWVGFDPNVLPGACVDIFTGKRRQEGVHKQGAGLTLLLCLRQAHRSTTT